MRFGDLEHGDQFYHNTYKWEKDIELRERVQDGGPFNGFFMNAKVIEPSHVINKAFFADHVEVELVSKRETR